MRNLIAAFLLVACGTASAQTSTFQLLSTNTNTIVGGGFVRQGDPFFSIAPNGYAASFQILCCMGSIFTPGTLAIYENGVPTHFAINGRDSFTGTITYSEAYLTMTESAWSYRYEFYSLVPQFQPFVSTDEGRVIFAASVPEPSTYAMLILGLGLVGVFGRRRLTRQSAVH